MKFSTSLVATLLVVTLLILGLSFSGGPASNGTFRTGAPSSGGGTESTCFGCHNSGASTFGEPVVSWNISATDGGANVMRYIPGQTYFVTVAVTAPGGAPAGYGFQSVFLNSPITGIPVGVGTASDPDGNTQVIANSGREYIEHNKRTPSGNWSFKWTAPVAGTGDVKIYSVGNAVNGMGGNSGDSGSSASTIITLLEQTLPVELTAFNARTDKQDVLLNWTSAIEENVSHFELEHSTDGAAFRQIASIPAVGNSNREEQYTYSDETALPGGNYYRLRMVDVDETFAYSAVISVTTANEETPVLSLFPNPAVHTVTLSNTLPGEGLIKVIAPNGRTIWQGANRNTLDVSNYPPGLYLVEVTNGQDRQVSRLIKQ